MDSYQKDHNEEPVNIDHYSPSDASAARKYFIYLVLKCHVLEQHMVRKTPMIA